MREKDGMWAVLCWLSILAHFNQGPSEVRMQCGRDGWMDRNCRIFGRGRGLRMRGACQLPGDELECELRDTAVKRAAGPVWGHIHGVVCPKQGVR